MNNPIIIGGISGLVSQTITWPLEYMKTIKQLPKYKNISIIKTIFSDIRLNGIPSIYRGLIPQIVSVIPRNALRFSVYENLKNKYQDENQQTSFWQKLSFGMIAGASEAITLTTPAEVIKVQLINQKYNYNNPNILNTLKFIYSNYGISGFYKGTLMTTIRQSTNHGITFLTVGITEPIYNDISYISSISNLLAGMTGGALAVTLNNPIDVIKTYKQSDKSKESINSIIKEIIKEKGIFGFYTGLGLRMSRVAPMYGITFYIYDFLKGRIN